MRWQKKKDSVFWNKIPSKCISKVFEHLTRLQRIIYNNMYNRPLNLKYYTLDISLDIFQLKYFNIYYKKYFLFF